MADETKPKDPLFVPLTEAIPAEDVARARFKVGLGQEGELKVAFEYSDEGIEWEPWTEQEG